jgi:hypothetical protein
MSSIRKDHVRKISVWPSKPPAWLFMIVFVIGLVVLYVEQTNKTAAIAEDAALVVILLVGIAQRRRKQPNRH